MDCVFCELREDRIRESNDHCIAIFDGFPISSGHTLVIPKRHVSSFCDLAAEERHALFSLVELAKHHLDVEYAPDGYNIGINDGTAAGQTVSHVHLHLIPRYSGDCDDPRGGVRWIMPSKAKYWIDDVD